MLKRIFKLLIFGLLFLGVEQFCHHYTWGFRMHKIFSTLTPDERFCNPELSSRELTSLKKKLDQPFSLIGKGNQSYAFVSEDGEIILKLFKHHHMNPNHYLKNIRLFGPLEKKRIDYVNKLTDRHEYTFSSIMISFNEMQEETGLIYTHLNKTNALFNQRVTLIDRIGLCHKIDLDQMEFIVQERAELIYHKLDALCKDHNWESAKRCISSYLELIDTRSRRGIRDEDASFRRNFGFVGERAITIDLGSFIHDVSLKKQIHARENFKKEIAKFHHWIKNDHPELLPHLEAEMAKRTDV